MGTIEIQRIDIVQLAVDAIVNAANDGLWAGSGVCGAIFEAAGRQELQAACHEIGHCDVGSAVITPAFKLNARYIIHAVGPQWRGGTHHEPKLLYGAYRRSLELAAENGCHSIGFPLLSAGIFGYPVDLAWRKALQACMDFQQSHKDTSLRIIFAVLDERIKATGQHVLEELGGAEHADGSLCVEGEKHDVIFFHLPEEPDGYLSNWYPASFTLDGITFSSTEQYMMYRKCRLFGDADSARAVMATDDPAMQQKIGKGASGFNSTVWNGRKQLILFRALMAKFSQNEDLRKQLLATGEAFLVECAHSDSIWACGIRRTEDERFDIEKWRGQNLLGFALMEVREALRSL